MEINLFKLAWNFAFPGFSRKKPTVLIVEDSTSDMDAICKAAIAEGFAVEKAQSAEGALGILHDNGRHFIAVLVDVGLPYMNGWKLAREINKHWPTLTVCIMSGSNEVLLPPERGRMFDVLWKDDNYFDVFRQLKQWKNL